MLPDPSPSPKTVEQAAKSVVNTGTPLISPCAALFEGLREEVVDEIDAFSPKNACPVHLPIAKTAAKAMVAALPDSYRGAIVRLEVTGHTGKQILVQVTPSLPKKS